MDLAYICVTITKEEVTNHKKGVNLTLLHDEYTVKCASAGCVPYDMIGEVVGVRVTCDTVEREPDRCPSERKQQETRSSHAAVTYASLKKYADWYSRERMEEVYWQIFTFSGKPSVYGLGIPLKSPVTGQTSADAAQSPVRSARRSRGIAYGVDQFRKEGDGR